MKIQDYSIVYTVIDDTYFYTSNNKGWLLSQLNILNVDLEQMNPETFKDLFNSMYFPYLHIYKVYYGSNNNKEDQVELNRLKEEEKHRWLTRKYNESNEIIYDNISKIIQTKFNQNLYNTVLYNERQEKLKYELIKDVKILENKVKELSDKKDKLDELNLDITLLEQHLQGLYNKNKIIEDEIKNKISTKELYIKELDDKINSLETIIENEIKNKISAKESHIKELDDKINSLETTYESKINYLRNDMEIKKQQYYDYIDKLYKGLNTDIPTIIEKSNAKLYDDLMKEFDYRLSFNIIKNHKKEILKWII